MTLLTVPKGVTVSEEACCMPVVHCPSFQAVANGHRNVAKHLLEKTDNTALAVTDHKGRMGLHYAAAIADHDDRGMYDWLTDEFSADEGKLDKVIN